MRESFEKYWEGYLKRFPEVVQHVGPELLTLLKSSCWLAYVCGGFHAKSGLWVNLTDFNKTKEEVMNL